MNHPAQILRFKGPVRRVNGPGRDGVTLLGQLLDESVPAQLSLMGGAGAALPAQLEDLAVELQAPTQLLLRSGSREWQLHCQTWQLHRDVGAAFYAAVPPRPTPWIRRLSWRLLLGIAATAPGRRLLSRRGQAR